MKKVLIALFLGLLAGWLVYDRVYVPSRVQEDVNRPEPPRPPRPKPPDAAPEPGDGLYLYEMGEYHKATLALDRELARGTASDPARHRATIALCWEKLGKEESTRTAWGEVVERHPDSVYAGDALYNLARRLPAESTKRREMMEQAFTQHPTSAGGRLAAAEIGRNRHKGNDLPGARRALTVALLAPGLSLDQRTAIEKDLDRINAVLVFSNAPAPGAVLHEVVSGESLAVIAKKYKTTVEMIRRCNGLSSDLIHPGQRIKILRGTFRIEVDKSSFRLVLFLDDDYVRSYLVGIGRPETDPTPTGEFTIATRILNPDWKGIPAADLRNILGTRWLGFKELPSYGLHGTTQPETIGRAVSGGCIRMRNGDVEELFDLVPVQTKILIRE